MIGHDIIDLQHRWKGAGHDRGRQLFPIGIPKIDGRPLGPRHLSGAGHDNAQEVLPVDLLGESFPQIVQEIVDDFLFLLERDKFPLQLGLQAEAHPQLHADVKKAQHGEDHAEANDVPNDAVHSA